MAKLSPKAKKVYSFEGIEIFVLTNKAKNNGKDHTWIQIRQPNKLKPWSINKVLSYGKGADIDLVI